MNWYQQFEDPLRSLETALRNLIHDELAKRHGPAWYWKEGIGLGLK